VNEALSIIKSRPNVVDLVQAGNIAGKAIELVPTTILHSMSYPLTGFYKIPHGRALGYLLPQVARFMEFNISEYIEPPNILLPDIFSYTLAREALTYKKVYDTEKEINLEILMELYKHHG
jgi:alcohol dehydrogenase class IV